MPEPRHAAALLAVAALAGCGGERSSVSDGRPLPTPTVEPESRESDLHTWARSARHWEQLAPAALPRVVRVPSLDRGYVTGTNEHEVVRGAVVAHVPRDWRPVGGDGTTFRARFSGPCLVRVRLSARAVATSQGSRFVTAPAFALYDKLGGGRRPAGSWSAGWGDGTRYHGDTSSYAARGIDARAGLQIAPRRFWMVSVFVTPQSCSNAQLADGSLPAAVIAVVRHVSSDARIVGA